MTTCVRIFGDVVQEAPASSTVSSRSSAHNEALRVDESTAGSPALESCTPCAGSPSENESDCEGSDPFEKPAKRKRYSRQGSVKFKIVEATSFEVGYLEAPILLDATTIEGIKMMRVWGKEMAVPGSQRLDREARSLPKGSAKSESRAHRGYCPGIRCGSAAKA